MDYTKIAIMSETGFDEQIYVEHVRGPLIEYFFQAHEDMRDIYKGRTVVSLGCGRGADAHIAKKMGASFVHGYDYFTSNSRYVDQFTLADYRNILPSLSTDRNTIVQAIGIESGSESLAEHILSEINKKETPPYAVLFTVDYITKEQLEHRLQPFLQAFKKYHIIESPTGEIMFAGFYYDDDGSMATSSPPQTDHPMDSQDS